MSIPIDNFKLPAIITGFPNNYPEIRPMVVADSLATITTAGYLNNAVLGGQSVSPFSLLPILYNYTEGQSSYTMGWFQVSITSGIITLFEQSSSHGATVTLPTLANSIAVFTNTAGNLGDAGTTAYNYAGNIQAGLSPVAGAFISQPNLANTGSFTFQAGANSGNFPIYFTNAAMGQSTIISVPDPGAATANVLLNTGTNTMLAGSKILLAKSTGTESGGNVTTTAQAGIITTSSLTTAAGSVYTITWTNSNITTNSVVLFTIMGGTNTVNQNLTIVVTTGSGSATLFLYNTSATAAFSGTFVLGYSIF